MSTTDEEARDEAERVAMIYEEVKRFNVHPEDVKVFMASGWRLESEWQASRKVEITDETVEQAARMGEGIDESNWGEFAAAVLEAEAEHWQNEFDNLSAKYGSYGAKKSRAAWVLGASMLKRRAGIYRTGDVQVTQPVPHDEITEGNNSE
jgi:ParB-like chromosome segregation protein Spo0J